MGNTTSTSHSACRSLHQPGSEMLNAKISSWRRPKTKLRMAGHLLFWLKMVLPSLSSPEERTGEFWLHLAPPSYSGSSTRRSRAAPVRACGDAWDMLVIWYLSVPFDFIFLPRAQALEPKEEISVQVRT